jgi:hypothetical protein
MKKVKTPEHKAKLTIIGLPTMSEQEVYSIILWLESQKRDLQEAITKKELTNFTTVFNSRVMK